MLLLKYYTFYKGWSIIVKKGGDLDCFPDLGNVVYYIGLGYS